MLDGKFEQGCPALERSYELDPLPGVLFTVAACFERWGKVHTAHVKYTRFVELHGQRDVSDLSDDKRKRAEERAAEAQKKVDELKPLVPRITIAVTSAPGAELQIDGAYVKETTPVDPGEHQVTAIAPDGRRKDETVTLAKGETKTVKFEFGTITVPEPEPVQDDGDLRGSMILGAIVAGSVGVVGLGVGAVTGGLVFAKKSDVDEQCENRVCTPEGKDAVDSAQTLGLVSTISFAVGGVGAATAVLLFLLAPADESEDMALDVRAGPDGAFVGWGARF